MRALAFTTASNLLCSCSGKRRTPVELEAKGQKEPGRPRTSAHAAAEQMPPHESPHSLVAKPATRTVIARVSPTADNLGVPYYLVNIAAKPYPAFQKNVRLLVEFAG